MTSRTFNSIREQIKQIIIECCDAKNIAESNSIGYAGLDVDLLKARLSSSFGSTLGMERADFQDTTVLRQVLDYLVKQAQLGQVMDCLQNQSHTITTSSSGVSSSMTGEHSPSHSVTTSSTPQSMKMKTNQYDKNIEYAIGIDIGHGETSAAICPIQWDKSDALLESVTSIEMESNVKVLPSAITFTDNGDAFIGSKAFQPQNLQNAIESHVCFKQMPQDINGKAEQIMIRFMREVYRIIREQFKAQLTDTNHVVAIATPSGWPSEAAELYKKMARKAGMPIEFVTKESRAAFVKAQKQQTSGLTRNLSKGAIVFDMGSSTLDFTYLNNSRQNQFIDHGYDCGASFVEKIMFKELEQNNPIMTAFLEKYPWLTANFLYEIRKGKEDIYRNPEYPFRNTINFDDFVDDDDDFEDERVKVKYKSGELNGLLQENGYLSQIREAMLDFKENHIKNAPIYGVLLTGGASRMDFIPALVKECWGIDFEPPKDQDPSLTISEGVAEVARMDIRNKNAMDSIDKMFHEINYDTIYISFVSKFKRQAEEDIMASIKSSLSCFKNSSNQMSLNDLQSSMTSSIKSSVDRLSTRINPIIEEVLKAETSPIEEKVKTVVDEYSARGIIINPPKLKVSGVTLNGININSVIRDISKSINEGNNDLVGAVAGGGVALLIGYVLGGPVFWAAAAGTAIYRWLSGENESEATKRTKKMAKQLDLKERNLAYDGIMKQENEIRSKVKESISNSLSSNKRIKDSIIQLSESILDEYKQCLKQARVQID